MKRGLGLTLGLMLISAPAVAKHHGPPTLVAQFMRAWDASDPGAISNLFTPQADLLAPDGVYAKGRRAIASYYAAAFARGYSGSKGGGQILQQRQIAPGLVLLDSRFSITGAHKEDGSLKGVENGMMVVVLRRVGKDWRIVALRERVGSDFNVLPPAP